MNIIKNKKRLILSTTVSLILGLFVSALMFVNSAKYELNPINSQRLTTGLCSGFIHTETAEASTRAGLPVSYTSYNGWIDVVTPCDVGVSDPAPTSVQSLRLFVSSIGTWQFFVNWLFWSGLVYVFGLAALKTYIKLT